MGYPDFCLLDGEGGARLRIMYVVFARDSRVQGAEADYVAHARHDPVHRGGFVGGTHRAHLGGVMERVLAFYLCVAERKAYRAVGEPVDEEGAVLVGGGRQRFAVGDLVADGGSLQPLAVAGVEHVA